MLPFSPKLVPNTSSLVTKKHIRIKNSLTCHVDTTARKKSLDKNAKDKRKDGTIVQYNDKGKKIGTYKLSGNKLVNPKR